MKSLLIGVGALITVAGIVFTLQGLGYVGGSVMSGVTFWLHNHLLEGAGRAQHGRGHQACQ